MRVGRSPLRVLMLEDSAVDAEVVRQELEHSLTPVVVERVDTECAFATALSSFAPDVVLADHTLAEFNAAAALEVLLAERPAVPLIVVSDAVDGETAVVCLRAGADDIVLKSNLGRLAPVIETALAVRRPLKQLSARQIEILRLVAEGQTTKQIASRLGLGAKTVESHRDEIRRRLDIHDLVALTRYAMRVGLVKPEA